MIIQYCTYNSLLLHRAFFNVPYLFAGIPSVLTIIFPGIKSGNQEFCFPLLFCISVNCYAINWITLISEKVVNGASYFFIVTGKSLWCSSECPKSKYFWIYVIDTSVAQKGSLEFVILLNSKKTLNGKIRNLESIFCHFMVVMTITFC